MEIGKFNTLSVVRETEIAYLLTDGDVEVFLHKKEALAPYQPGDEITVFLYVDNVGRITASTKEPLITKGEVKALEVVSVKPRYGAFLNDGMIKDLLLSLDDLPHDLTLWPGIGDYVYVEMIEKNGTLFAHIPTRAQLAQRFHEKPPLVEKQVIPATVMYLMPEGLVAFTSEGHEIFIHKNNQRQNHRIGETIEPKILKHNPNGVYSATLIEQKELMLDKDASDILDYLKQHQGSMPYTDKTDPETISKVFHMSKSAFKRALGSLYKARHVDLGKNETKIIK